MSVVFGGQDHTKKDYILIFNAKEILQPETVFVVEFKCSTEMYAGFELVVDTALRTGVIVFKNVVECHTHSDNVVKRLPITAVLPDALAYRPDMFNKNSVLVKNVKVRAWLLEKSLRKISRRLSYDIALIRVSYGTSILPPFSRAAKPANGCSSWSRDILANLSARRFPTCAQEKRE